jgi:L-ascorbate metabolism protein UlaG (beta-lactamase superfamily)
MFITRLGSSEFLIKDKAKKSKVSIVLGWQDKIKKHLKEANVVLAGFGVSIDDLPDNNFLINCPGEYDVHDVFIRGIQDGKNIIYVLDLFGEKIAYLDGLEKVNLEDKKIEQLGEVHLLLISINGREMDARAAAKIINRIEPRMVIPMNYKAEDLSQFLKTLGAEKTSVEESIDIQAENLSPESVVVKVLKDK